MGSRGGYSGNVVATYASSARRAAAGQGLRSLARLGLCARAFVYLMIGFLAVLVALGRSNAETDQSGALQQLNGQPLGHAVIWVLAVGLAGYALWRLSEAVFGAAGEGRKAGPRLASLGRAIAYTFFAINAFQVAISNSTSSQAGREVTLTARVMTYSGGRVLVAVVGVAFVLAGLVLAYEGVARKFEKHLETGGLAEPTRRAVTVLGTVGTTARGIVFALAGAFVVQAAVSYQPSKAAGIDQALRSLRDTAVGPALLLVVALGLIAFGIYGFAEARWRRVEAPVTSARS